MDYRYFPEPDLVPIAPSEQWVEAVRATLPQLPAERRGRLSEATKGDLAPGSEMIVTVVNLDLDPLVLGAVDAGADARRAISRAANDLAAAGVSADAVGVGAFADLLLMEGDGRLTATQAKTVLGEMIARGPAADPQAIAKERGFEVMAGAAAMTLVDTLIAKHPVEFERLRGGDAKVTGFFVGQAMQLSDKKADGRVVTALLRERAGLA